VEVIRYHAKFLQNPSAFLTGLKKAILEGTMGSVIDKQVLPVVPAIDDVIDSVWLFDS
jgi:hypothetical protein